MRIAIAVIIGLLLAVAAKVGAVTTNPASNATADSANTPLTIIYRDAAGAFSAGIASLSGLVMSGPVGHQSRTVAQLQAIVPALGDSYYCSDCSPKKLVVSTGTSAGNFADAVGGAFK